MTSKKNTTVMLADMMYVPRLVPLSLQTPMAAVACGPTFTIAISKVRRPIDFYIFRMTIRMTISPYLLFFEFY